MRSSRTNPGKVKKVENELRQLCSRIAAALESYTDEPGESGQ